MIPQARELVVTTNIDGKTHTRIWNPKTPLPVGHPFEWVLEPAAQGVRIRYLKSNFGETTTHASTLITSQMIHSGQNVQLPGRPKKDKLNDCFVSIKIAKELLPVFETPKNQKEGKIYLFQCSGSWALSSTPITQKSHSVSAFGKELFRIHQKANYEIKIDFINPNLFLWKEGNTKASKVSESSVVFNKLELIEQVLLYGHLSWRFGLIPESNLPLQSKNKPLLEKDIEWFKKSIIASLVGLFTLSLFTFLKPSSAPKEEIIPEQFTKIVMAPPQKAAPAPSGAESAASQQTKEVAKKAAETKVVQAFRAQALQNAVSGLLKGGMTKLLAQSDFVIGNSKSTEGRKLFNQKSDALRATAITVGDGNPNVKVASVGGEESSGSGTTGYRKGQHAGVDGQGKSFISMDITASSVEEGLTKEEVGEVIHRHLSEVRYCYESAILKTPELQGKLIVAFSIGATGIVKSANVQSSTIPDPRLDDCILRRLVTWKFPQTKGGVTVAVSYPFIFKTLGR